MTNGGTQFHAFVLLIGLWGTWRPKFLILCTTKRKKELAYERIQKVWEAMVSCIEDWPKTRFEHPMMKSILMKRKCFNLFGTLCCVCVNAVDIKRYVKEGGTGNGLTWEAPTGDLASCSAWLLRLTI
jgi:F0F1-type ATP synthase membrane subunit a